MKFILVLISIIYLSLSNIYCVATEIEKDKDILKIGLIIPLSGKNQEIGKSVLNSVRLAISQINDDKIEIFPKDNNSSPEKTLLVAKQLKDEGIKIIIGPIYHQNLIYLDELQDITFLSLSNKTKSFPKNVFTIGINANSQMEKVVNFIKKKNLNRVIILIPKSNYEDEIKDAIVKAKYNFSNIYSYDVDASKLTSHIKQITAYDERKKNLERRIEILEKSDSNVDKIELEDLKKKYTIGEINFDGVVIADFGENLKSVANSFNFADVTSKDVVFITLNQWFDESLFKETSLDNIFFPSVNLFNFSKFRELYFKNYNKYPSKLSILSYDVLGLIYYLKKKQENISLKDSFNQKNSFVGEIGEFRFENRVVTHKLKIYQIRNNKFIEIKQ